MKAGPSWFGQREKVNALILFLIVSMTSARGIEFVLPWGADLQNLVAYQACTKGGANPYLIPGKVCGDLWTRSLFYPPLMFHSYVWTRGLKLETAMYLWCSFILLAFAGCFWAWRRMALPERRDRRDWVPVAFGLLLIVQYPSLFTLERGGSDIGPLFLWTVAAVFLIRGRLIPAGLAAGLATAYKLYPVFPCAAATIGLLLGSWGANRRPRTDFLRFGGAAALAFFAVSAIFRRDSLWFFKHVLPDVSSLRMGTSVYGHSIPAMCGTHDLFANLICLGLVGTWTWASRRGLREEPALTLAGLLAMSTYFAGISHDYNLITAYPLLLLLLLRARTTGRFGLLALGLVAIVGDRELFRTPGAHVFTPILHVALQLAWLILVAIEVGAAPAAPDGPAPDPVPGGGPDPARLSRLVGEPRLRPIDDTIADAPSTAPAVVAGSAR
jgi:hypothetical protein